MWDLDLVTDTSVRSLRHDQIFGYSSPLPTWGMAIFLTHVVPEDREAAQRAFETAFTSGKFDMECRILRPDTSISWISAKGRVYRNHEGDPVRMMGTIADITENKRAEQRLKESRRSFPGSCRFLPTPSSPSTISSESSSSTMERSRSSGTRRRRRSGCPWTVSYPSGFARFIVSTSRRLRQAI